MITVGQFKTIFPANKEADTWVEAINKVCPLYDINTPVRLAGFLSQCGHESAGFTRLTENLNYSHVGLQTVFKKYFTPDQAMEYSRQPERIANKVYANRMGNGDEASGEGWKYRGRGPIQLTGKSNYVAFSNEMLEDYKFNVISDPDYVASDKDLALMSAIWYWNSRKLNKLADAKDIVGMTRAVNGGTHGLVERGDLFKKICNILKV